MSGSNCELPNTSALFPKTHIYVLAFFILCKRFYSLALIAINFPAAGAFAVLSGILDKANDIAKRIAEKNTYLMRKFL